jgi:16S rRNA (cytosine967-C5)-methyltransferase
MAADCRATAARVVGEVLAGRSLSQLLPPALERVSPRDRALLQQLCYGTLRDGPRLLALLRPLLDKPLKEKDRDLQGLLLCGLHQVEALRIPDHAAVSATVQATRQLRKNWARGMVNAVLRRFLREREALLAGLDEAAQAAHPHWLYQAILQQWPEHAGQIMASANSAPPLTLRVNAGRSSRDDYLQQLHSHGIDARPGSLSPQAVYLQSPLDVTDLPGFADGLVSVQDEAAQMAAGLLAAEAGDSVLDACAAPGGKTCHILELQPQLAELVAIDNDPQRLERVADNLARLGLTAELQAADAAAADEVLGDRRFNRILVDAPCSATGVIRRHPDIKLLRRDTDIQGFAAQQLQLLQGLWPRLLQGGRLLYVTCSVLADENQRLVQRFIHAHPDCRLLPMSPDWGVDCAPGRQILPRTGGPDGLFYAAMEKHC